jgi:hypothetical protein
MVCNDFKKYSGLSDKMGLVQIKRNQQDFSRFMKESVIDGSLQRWPLTELIIAEKRAGGN